MLFRLTLKNIADKKVRFFLTTLSVVLGVMFTVGVFIFSDSLRAVFSDLSEDIAGRTDLSVRSQQDFGDRLTAPLVDPDLAPIIESVDGVQATSAGIAEFGVTVIDEDGNPLRGQAPTFGTNWVEEENMSNLFIAEGREPRNSSEFAMNANSVEDDNLTIGETYIIQVPTGPQEFTLVGSFNFAEEDRDQSIGAKLVSFDLDTATQLLKGGQGWDQIDIDVASNANEEAVRLAIQERVNEACQAREADCEAALEVITGQEIQQEQEDEFNAFIGIFQTTLLVFAVIILLVSIFVIFNTFTIVLGQRIRELGLLRALGASGGQVIRSVLGEAVIVGLVSSGLGILAGIGLAYILRAALNATGFDLPIESFAILPRTIWVAFAVGTGVTLISALVPALRTRFISPMAALRDEASPVGHEVPRRLVLGGLLSAAGIAAVVLAFLSNWQGMLFWASIATILLIVGGKRLHRDAGRWAALALGLAFLMVAIFGSLNTGEQAMALGIGAAVLVIGVYLISPLFTPQLSRTIGSPLSAAAKLKLPFGVHLAIAVVAGFIANRLIAITTNGAVAFFFGVIVTILLLARSKIASTLSKENAARSPRRTTTTAAALMVSLALVTTVGISAQSLRSTWKDSLDDAVLADWFICPSDCGAAGEGANLLAFSPALANDLEELPEIESTVSYRWDAEGLAISSDIDTPYSVFAAEFSEAGQHIDLDVQEGSITDFGETNPDVHNVGVHEDIAEELGLSLGSPTPVLFNSRQQPVVFVVTAIYSDELIADISWLIDLSTWEEYFTRNLDLFVSATTASGVNQAEARAAIDTVAENYTQLEVQTKQEFNDDQVGAIDSVVLVVNIFLSLALVIAFIGIANTLALSVIERTRELGLLRAVGMRRAQMMRMILDEGFIIALYGGVLGVGLGIVFATTIVNVLPNDFISDLTIHWWTLAAYLIIAATAGLISALLPARRASRLNVLEAIATE